MFLKGLSMAVYDSITAWINSFLNCIGGCLGCGSKQTHSPPVDDPTKGALVTEKPSLSEDFWGTSTGDIDYPVGLSQRSISSLSTSNLSFHSDLVSTSANAHNEFKNHGLLRWNQIRLQWIGGTSSANQSHDAQGPAISLSATYNSLLSSKDRFRHPIPLSEMVEFLVDVWEQEGLYD